MFYQRISLQLGQFQGNMGHSYFVCRIKLLLKGCFPQHLSREEYPSGHAGGISVMFSLSKGIETTLIRDDESEGQKVWDVLSVCLSVPLVKKTISVIISYQFRPGKERNDRDLYLFPY